ncbi:MAG: amidohydrolase family protein [Pseudonocardiaceae bacterium]
MAGGAAVIKVGLERGGEAGAPWSEFGHGTPDPLPWPLMPVSTLRAIVDEAHSLGRLVTAHVGEPGGVELSLDGGVDEWAHVPCDPVPPALLQRAVNQGVKIVTTLDTLSRCTGIFPNARALAGFGAKFRYGAEIAHTDIPWGIDAQELHLMVHLAGLTPIEALRAATSEAGKELGLGTLGTLTPGAPADLIAVPGDPSSHFKPLEYPRLVISGGRIVVNDFR